MKYQLPQVYFSKILRAIVEFDLIQEGDAILIGLSGGKDSLFLTYAMAMMKEHLKKRFTLRAFTVNPNFSPDFDVETLRAFSKSLNIPFAAQTVDIAAMIAGEASKSACYTCAFFRRGAINRYAKEQGCNKIAYAHHNDDAVETLLMSLLYSGQIKTFAPKTYLDRTNLTVIRPLVYLREDEIREAARFHGMTPVPSPCPRDGKTIRQDIKALIAKLTFENPLIYPHLAAALRENNVGELWPPTKSRKEMAGTYHRYMKGYPHLKTHFCPPSP